MNDPIAKSKGAAGSGLQGVLRAMLLGFCFVAGGVATAKLVGAFLPFPQIPQLGARFRYFAENRNEFDVLFIGSSRIHSQLIPQLFDTQTGARGLATHSFNLGYDGMWPPESFYFLRKVLALHPARLRWVIIELMDYRFGELERNPHTIRAVYWHDWKHSVIAWRLILESPMPVGEKCRQLVLHTSLFLRRLANFGRLAEVMRSYFFGPPREDLGWTKRAGFDPEMETGAWTAWARAAFARQVEAVTKSLPPRTVRPGFSAALRDLLSDLRKAGVKPIFLIAPTIRPEENLALGLPEGPPVLAFNHPADYPQLYVPETHAEPRHLNEKGAREFTRLVAEQFVDYVVRP